MTMPAASCGRCPSSKPRELSHAERQITALLEVQQLLDEHHFMQVSKWLGHSTFTLTLDVYGDYIPEEDGGALNALPEPPAPGSYRPAAEIT